MQKLLFLFVSALLYSGINAQESIDKILGTWVNEDRTRIIEFVKNGSSYDAIIRKADDPKLVGKKQITGLKKSGNTSFKNGVVHLIKQGKTAKCSARLVNENRLELNASYGMMSKTQIWTRL